MRDIVIHDDNMVQFTLKSEDAKLKAARISTVVGVMLFRGNIVVFCIDKSGILWKVLRSPNLFQY